MSKLRKWMMKEERVDTNSQGSTDLSSSAIKLFGQTIAVSGSADSKAASEEVDGASTQLCEGENLGSMCTETGSKENGSEEVSVSVTGLTQEEKKEQCLKKPGKLIPCPRCDSVDTKFCYYNNYNINQPRHFCKSCQRYWTAGGTLRNVLVGAGRRKNKYGSTSSGSAVTGPKPESSTEAAAVRVDYHEPAQSAFKPLGPPESESVSKLRQSVAGGGESEAKQQQQPTYVLTPRPAPETQMWTKPAASAPAAPVGFFNGAWPYGYNIGLSGAGSNPIVGGAWPGVCVPTFGWNMLQGGWTLPWRPVPAATVGVQMQGQVQQHQQMSNVVTGVSRKREAPSSITEGERKIPRVAADNPTVVA